MLCALMNIAGTATLRVRCAQNPTELLRAVSPRVSLAKLEEAARTMFCSVEVAGYYLSLQFKKLVFFRETIYRSVRTSFRICLDFST